jgi:hypothetical protein
MNWRLILLLSLFGAAMAYPTVAIIPEAAEPFFWIAIFFISALAIGKYAGKRYFLHGLLVSVANSIWVAVVHSINYHHYIAHHDYLADLSENLPIYLQTHPHRTIVLFNPVIGIVLGIVLGLLSMLAARIVRK